MNKQNQSGDVGRRSLPKNTETKGGEPAALADVLLPSRLANADRVSELRFTAPGRGENIVNFNTEYAESLTPRNIQQLERILRVDPFFNSGRPGDIEGKVLVSKPEEALALINTYIAGGILRILKAEKIKNLLHLHLKQSKLLLLWLAGIFPIAVHFQILQKLNRLVIF
jgi:hypothetical protein